MSRLSDVNAFIEQSRTCRTADDLRGIMEGITREMGFHSYAVFQHTRDFDWHDPNLLALSNYPRHWLEYFLAHELTSEDPVNLASHRTSVGFRFAEIPSLIVMTEKHRIILAAARQHGLADGFCVPAHVPGEVEGSCTFTVSANDGLPEANLPMAQLVGSFAYDAARRIQGGRLSHAGSRELPLDIPSVPITGRQLECLALVARGKSDWEIGRIIGIGQETVKHHIKEARERYGVATRVQAAIRAISQGHLSIHDVA